MTPLGSRGDVSVADRGVTAASQRFFENNFARRAMQTKTYSTILISRARAMRRDMPLAERKLWFEGLSSLPFKFRRQRPVGRYIVDFYCAAAQLVIELDGATHDSGVAQDYDATRTAYLHSVGLKVVRFTNGDVMTNLVGVLFEITRVLQEQPLRHQPLRPSGISPTS